MNGGHALHGGLSSVTEQLGRALDPLKVYHLPTIEALLIFLFYRFFFLHWLIS